jgi:hypothetical protein
VIAWRCVYLKVLHLSRYSRSYRLVGLQGSSTGAGYIYGRYKLVGNTELDASFFPVTYSRSQDPTSWISGYVTSIPTVLASTDVSS